MEDKPEVASNDDGTNSERLGMSVRPLSPEEKQQSDLKDGLVVEDVDGAAAERGHSPRRRRAVGERQGRAQRRGAAQPRYRTRRTTSHCSCSAATRGSSCRSSSAKCCVPLPLRRERSRSAGRALRRAAEPSSCDPGGPASATHIERPSLLEQVSAENSVAAGAIFEAREILSRGGNVDLRGRSQRRALGQSPHPACRPTSPAEAGEVTESHRLRARAAAAAQFVFLRAAMINVISVERGRLRVLERRRERFVDRLETALLRHLEELAERLDHEVGRLQVGDACSRCASRDRRSGGSGSVSGRSTANTVSVGPERMPAP